MVSENSTDYRIEDVIDFSLYIIYTSANELKLVDFVLF